MPRPLPPAVAGLRVGWRELETLTLYLAYGVGAYAVNGMGQILLPLQEEIGASRAEVALYPTVYSVATITIGLTGAALVRRLGESRMLAAGFAVSILGAALFWWATPASLLVGALLLGLGSCSTIQVFPARMSILHPGRITQAVTEANASASTAAVIAPLLVGAALGAGAGWRVGWLLPILLFATLLLAFRLFQGGGDDDAPPAPAAPASVPAAVSTADPAPAATPAPAPASAPAIRGSVLVRWIDIVLSVSVEFAVIFWASSSIVERFGVPLATAVLTAGSFLLGMAVGRIVGARHVERGAPHLLVTRAGIVSLAGFAVFWLSPWLWLAAVGLAVCALGLCLLFPLAMGRLMRAAPDARRASALGVLGIGISTGLAPLALAALAEVIGIRWAFLMVPAMLIVLIAKNLRAAPGEAGPTEIEVAPVPDTLG